jgi:VWFA-related protein
MRRSLAFVLLAAALAQEAQEPADPVIRVSVKLVQVDAIVTDRQGRKVGDLGRDDFEILQDGKPRAITSFSLVRSAGPRAAATGAPPPGPTRPAREEVRRTVAIVVDDLGLSFQSTAAVREALRRFIDRDIHDGDLVAILRTGGGMGAFQEFSTDRAMLRTVAQRIGWNPQSRVGVSPFAADNDASIDIQNTSDMLTSDYTDFAALGSLGSLRHILDGLREMPGRKSLMLFSEGMNLFRDGTAGQVAQEFRRLTDHANRSAVTIYTIDPRGLQTLGPSAADATIGARIRGSGEAGLDPTNARRDAYFDSQHPLFSLAADTGGIFYRDSNDIAGSLRQALEDQDIYYLLGYNPGEEAFNREYHKISVRVKRPGLKVRSRDGFIGEEDRPAPPPITGEPAARALVRALSSPFRTGAIKTRLTCFFGAEKQEGMVQSALHIDGSSLRFQKDESGRHRARIEVLAASFSETGAMADQTTQGYNVVLDEAGLKAARQFGLTYMVRYRVKKPGPYQVRVAIRDAGSGQVGSASQFLNVPDLKKGRPALSGIFLREQPPEGERGHPNATPAARMFPRGRQVAWLAQVYNPKSGSDGVPRLTASVRVFHDGKPVFQTQPVSVASKPLEGRTEVLAAGALRLGSKMDLGDYTLQLTVKDELAGPKSAALTQWIDFQIVP